MLIASDLLHFAGGYRPNPHTYTLTYTHSNVLVDWQYTHIFSETTTYLLAFTIVILTVARFQNVIHVLPHTYTHTRAHIV